MQLPVKLAKWMMGEFSSNQSQLDICLDLLRTCPPHKLKMKTMTTYGLYVSDLAMHIVLVN